MTFLMEVCKWIFFFLTMIVGLIFLRGENIMSTQALSITKNILMPWYMIFAGIMLGYVLANIQIGYEEDKSEAVKIYTKFFLIGISIGILLWVIYIVM